MTIKCLKISDIRNLNAITLSPSSKVNLFFGDNGSGKTSLLEAIHFLAVARSFRTSRLAPVIAKGKRSCTVYGDVSVSGESIPVGVTRSLDSQQLIRINGLNDSSVSDLAHVLPIQLMNPEIFTCLQDGPSNRRKLLDWGVFHQDTRFFVAWKRMQSSLKQRNSLLKSKSFGREELAVWTQMFLSSSLIVDQLRADYIELLIPEVEALLLNLTELSGLNLMYSRGWSKNFSLEEVLERDMNKDRALGYTTSGPQRFDIKVTYQGGPADEVLSRGQQKLVVCAIKLAQGRLFEQLHKRACIYLIDDLPSELDEAHSVLFADTLKEMQSQVWVTGVHENALRCIFSDSDTKVFHVEHGNILSV